MLRSCPQPALREAKDELAQSRCKRKMVVLAEKLAPYPMSAKEVRQTDTGPVMSLDDMFDKELKVCLMLCNIEEKSPGEYVVIKGVLRSMARKHMVQGRVARMLIYMRLYKAFEVLGNYIRSHRHILKKVKESSKSYRLKLYELNLQLQAPLSSQGQDMLNGPQTESKGDEIEDHFWGPTGQETHTSVDSPDSELQKSGSKQIFLEARKENDEKLKEEVQEYEQILQGLAVRQKAVKICKCSAPL